MSDNWEKEYEQRLRRVVGVEDDSRAVWVDTDFEEGYGGGCDTCDYGSDPGRVVITVCVRDGSSPYGYARKEYSDMGQLLREMGEVEL